MKNSNIIFSNFQYNPEKYYFLFISELKAYGLGYFFKEAISKIFKIDISKIEFLSIAPDVFEQYNYDNLIIINDTDKKINRRKKLDDFIKDVSSSTYIDSVISKILKNQKELFVYMFESSIYMTLDKKKNLFLIGPKADIVAKLNNKITLYEMFSKIVPMAPYEVVEGYEQLIAKARTMIELYDEKIFISLEKSAAGVNSIATKDLKSIEDKFGLCKNETFLLTKYISHKSDPTSLGVVINEDEIFVAGIADQNIEGTKFRGSTFPSKESIKVQKRIIELTRTIGKHIAKLGYRGIFGCDFIVTENEEVFFIEVNPRKQGTTMEFCCTLRNLLPKNSPNLPEIEFYAVRESKKAPNLKEINFFNINFCWGTYNYKIDSSITTKSYLPHNNDEIAMFDRIAKNKIKKEFMIVEHIGQDFFADAGSFLGRVIAVGKNYNDVHSGIQIGKSLLQYTVKDGISKTSLPYKACQNCKYYLDYLDSINNISKSERII